MKGSEGSSEVKRVGKEVCQERRVLKKSGRSVSGLGLQSCQQEELKTRFRDDKGKQDQDKVASVEKDVERKRCQGKRLDKQQAPGRAVKNQR